jgi:uncharacterized membrane protein YfcA
VEWYFIAPAVMVTGFAAGFINTLAGSGSLITLPLLIFLGLPASVANGTNRVGVLVQNIVSVGTFRQRNMLDTRGGLLLSIPAIIGAIIGAQLAVNLDEELLKRTIGALMVVMLVVVLVRPKRWLQERTGNPRPGPIQFIIFFFIGVYGGFIQAGVGIFLLAGLVLSAGYDLVRANAVKALIVLMFTIAALAVFIFNDQVRWDLGLLLAAGNAAGAWAAARMAVEKGAEFVRWVLIAILVVSAAGLLGVVELPGAGA